MSQFITVWLIVYNIMSNHQCCIKFFLKVFKIQVGLQVLSCKSILNTVENTVLQKYLKYWILNTYSKVFKILNTLLQANI